jgi:molybdopterin-binding protein
MRLSARNILPATVKAVTPGAKAYAIVKASNVMIGVD